MMKNIAAVVEALSREMPPILRWGGAIARQIRPFNVAVAGKDSGNANTDALTLADLSVQELIVAALRDGDPVFRECRIEGEESTGDTRFFNQNAELAITIDPIDGTKQYRDRDGDGYCVMLQLQMPDDVHYSLVYVPETGEFGTWTEVKDGKIYCGEDDPAQSANEVLSGMEPWNHRRETDSRRIYMIGFQERDAERAASLAAIGLEGVISANMPGSIYPLMATGEFAGSLIHSPNIYDFPASMQIARSLGGDALWVHNQEPVHFKQLWMDDRASMLRLPGIVACSPCRETVVAMCEHAADWNPERYAQ